MTNNNFEQKLFKYSDKLSEIEGKIDMAIKQINAINKRLDQQEDIEAMKEYDRSLG